MKKAIMAMLMLGLVVACQKVPLTGRNQLVLIPNTQMLPLSFTNYKEVLDTSKIVRSGGQEDMIKRVGSRIQKAVETYMAANNLSERLNGFQWEFNLIESPQVNAWCMPGGKVAFYTGILPYTQNEAGVATVMGHEVSHAIAEHGNERMSEGLLANGLMQGGQLVLGSLSQNQRSQTNALLLQAVGAGLPVAYQVGRALPHSRAQESEADKLGLIFMSMAGYNPQEAVSFWGRMAKAGSGQKPPEFLSTHPSDERRIRDLEKQMPDAMKYYQKSR
ncbi:M48 family metallopeptidase [Larkinella knui]|uniref:M48 family peptidase n=1 Tax=Larkinella knui TaxID=2025310 RepID=A0A3P1CUH7_9BACT|nr:M48 family metallopeptidase [Larkinella knui]RRB16977.1 M48 family peptidase [Larkinella knui]